MKKRLLSTLLVLCMVLALLPGTAWAATVASGTCGNNLTWELDEDGTLTIFGTGSMSDFSYTNYAPWYDGRSQITTVIVEAGVTSIGNNAFSDCNSLTSVTIPGSVTSIGSSAFSSCSSLISITIPAGVTSIGDRAFQNCTSLISVDFPAGVTSIGDWAFSYCSSLTRVTIPGSVNFIGNSAFYSCSSMTSVTILEGVTSIGTEAFSHCTSLTSVTIPESVTSIEKSAFFYCSSLASVTIPASVTSIGSSAFSACDDQLCIYCYFGSYAESYAIDNWIDYMFLDGADVIVASGACRDNLTWTLDGEGTLTISGTEDMEDYSYSSTPWYGNRKQIKTVVISNGVTSIGNYAFYNCSNLTSVTLPNSVIDIGDYAFQWCESLPRIDLPDSVVSIGEQALSRTAMTSVTIPAGVTTIGHLAFGLNYQLVSINVAENNPSYCSVDGVLFNKDISMLIFFPSGRTDTNYTIPASVIEIASEAFNNSSLTSIRIPSNVKTIDSSAFWMADFTEAILEEGVTTIGSQAFGACYDLTRITLPSTLEYVGWYAFYNIMGGVKDIYYAGTEEQWQQITFEITVGYDPETGYILGEGSFDEGGAESSWLNSADIYYNSTGSVFTDVPIGVWYTDAVAWAVEKGVTSGTGDGTTFSPDQPCSRKEIVTFLWRAYGQPEPVSTENPFTDVKPTDWYYKAVLWAVENGITSGTSATTFNPDGICTCKEPVTFQYRAAGSPAVTGSSSFNDVSEGEWYANAVAWAVANGITSGTGSGVFSPEQTCTRSQIVTFLYRELAK